MARTPSPVVILGASDKPERYAYKAQKMLTEYGYGVLPISRRVPEVLGVPTVRHLLEIAQPIDTVTLYVGPAHLSPQVDALIALKPRRVIFNPGTEDAAIEARLQAAGIITEEACTLVLLRTEQFDH